ncbi:hypothetical protein C475_09002 [Halosimplex carlsbadense 2-9-1]|uniref:Uncharacterized protein n=1 Tax=Halosimplex carlsbadense 2-9-1 TaxID=797114 RepID=M0CVV9_9EURY|nr:hypothetical protein [Halosimplex carlsbadense]ELZ26552.1 hypothetical protein C475_09002 [Halosimplex carlsbadense 2-9-1]
MPRKHKRNDSDSESAATAGRGEYEARDHNVDSSQVQLPDDANGDADAGDSGVEMETGWEGLDALTEDMIKDGDDGGDWAADTFVGSEISDYGQESRQHVKVAAQTDGSRRYVTRVDDYFVDAEEVRTRVVDRSQAIEALGGDAGRSAIVEKTPEDDHLGEQVPNGEYVVREEVAGESLAEAGNHAGLEDGVALSEEQRDGVHDTMAAAALTGVEGMHAENMVVDENGNASIVDLDSKRTFSEHANADADISVKEWYFSSQINGVDSDEAFDRMCSLAEDWRDNRFERKNVPADVREIVDENVAWLEENGHI